MKLTVVAVGHKMPGWVDAAFADYAKRLPRNFAFALVEVRPEARSSGKSVPQLLSAEAARIEAATPQGAARVVCDEHGEDLTTMRLSEKLRHWQDSATDIAMRSRWPRQIDQGQRSPEYPAVESDLATRIGPRAARRANLPRLVDSAKPPLPSRVSAESGVENGKW